MIKFFVEKENIAGKAVYIDDRDDIRHLVKVLRAKAGDRVLISDKAEWEYETEIESISRDEVRLRIIDKQKMATEPETRAVLYQGIPKGSKMETIIQKCVELGIDSIVPVFMDRTVVTDSGGFHKKTERWQKISDEAVKQCKRGRIPEVCEPLDFDGMLAEIAGGDYSIVILPYENEEGRTIKEALREYAEGVLPLKSGRVAIIIGPEGGFAESEIEKAKAVLGRNETCQSGETIRDDEIEKYIPPRRELEIVSLGKTILRTETAGPTALAMVMYELEL